MKCGCRNFSVDIHKLVSLLKHKTGAHLQGAALFLETNREKRSEKGNYLGNESRFARPIEKQTSLDAFLLE